MSVLTKLFVVLVTILAVVLMAMVVSFSANSENYKKLYDDQKTLRELAEKKARNAQLEINLAQELADKKVADAARTIEDLQRQYDLTLSDLNTSQQVVVDLQGQVNNLAADGSRLQAAVKQLSDLLESHSKELAQRRERMAELQRENIELVDRNSELQSERDTLGRLARRTSEELSVREEEILSFERIIATLPPGVIPVDPTTVESAEDPIWGVVTGIEDFAGEKRVLLNIGSNDGVEERMIFLVARGESIYLGKVVVETVEIDAAVARVEYLNAEVGDITEGDTVYSGP